MIKGRDIVLGIREDDPEAWKRQMSAVVDTIPFEYIGFGTQNTIKIKLALRNANEQANIVLMEEPENHLSFTNMAVLVKDILKSQGKQVFISTHSSYVANKLNLSNMILVRSGVTIPYNTLPENTKKYFVKLPGYDTLRFILASKVILVEGPTDDLIVQRAYLDRYGKLPIEDGIDIIAVDSLAFKRYCDIAIIMKKPTVIVTDNDGNIEENIESKYKDYHQYDFLTFYFEKDEKLSTIEPSVLAANLEDGQPTQQFKQIISVNDSLMKKSYQEILNFMSNNKTEWAYRVFEANEQINYPEYITNAIEHFSKHS